MTTAELEAKGEEPKDEAVKEQDVKARIVGFARRHKKKIIIGASVIAGVVIAGVVAYVWIKSSNDDEDNDYDGYDDSLNSIPYADTVDKTPRNYPKRDIAGIDVTGSHIKKNEKQFLEDFSTQYDRFKGKEQTIVINHDDVYSGGRYTRQTTTKYSFREDRMGIDVNISYIDDDDGQTDEYNYTIDTGRDLINFLKRNKKLKMLDDVQDIVDV
ncbi:hypothetical protein SAMN02745136_00502 [Anaerocolumna jejuensis DSM 15929]|uniref:Uncharacterized protein n=1 Tax=Anaerocolumna jejuensis DSM 15929 TaxID=1121322 RepID=A0A1M6KLW0_9FIRM|nr:hypothetical protein [Anaerocolumna jejuensis]SHJ59988.1 hypothetical protein SAMN02745136_00502 [Anaerocolumna jejuensis DSM 15929]